ncbi:PREDICTED: uncharacterized protein LOC104799340 [Tarenaya hassleriana]|uniref:uncharacterized protein LOC104799340 n=1 Tax=Tarenaya hassleriana TaxID=28532 RepID=UPI00053C1B61|nr:PREDICTED: uncharacterized protein LOC104799340 [Tarenaya hassleriana]
MRLEDLLVQNGSMRLEDLLVQEETPEHKVTHHDDDDGDDDDDDEDQGHHHHHHQQQEPVKFVDRTDEDEKMALAKKKKKKSLEKEVTKLQGELEDEQALNKALRAMMRGPVLSQPRLSLLLLPPQVQELIEELASVEAEILCLEKRVCELKLDVYTEKKESEERESMASLLKDGDEEAEEEHRMHPKRLQRQNHLPCDTSKDLLSDTKPRSKSQSYGNVMKETITKSSRTVSMGSAMEFSRITLSNFSGELKEKRADQAMEKNWKDSPNSVSEELVKCLMGIYFELSLTSREREGSNTVSKLSLLHLKSASFKRKSVYEHNASNLDPYGVVTGTSVRDIGQYKNFIHITRSSVDVSRLSDCSTSIVNLRVFLEKLSKVDPSFLSHKKKLAFWINSYNACVMNGFLEHGLPSSKEKLLATHRMATINVGGTRLNALEIEQLILQNPFEHKEPIAVGEKEINLERRYGLMCKEPNLVFVLCHGDWSSPAVRVYTSEEVVNELIKARTEYLEASIGVTSRRKIVVPRLLHSRLRDFTEDEKSLLEWICSQLPPLQRCLQLKEAMMDCLKLTTSVPMDKVFEVRPHHYEFRYLLPL